MRCEDRGRRKMHAYRLVLSMKQWPPAHVVPLGTVAGDLPSFLHIGHARSFGRTARRFVGLAPVSNASSKTTSIPKEEHIDV